MIHPTAIVCPGAVVGRNCRLGAYSVIEDGCVLGEDCQVESHAVIKRGARLERGVHVHSCAVVGGDPQDLSFDPGIVSGVRIGAESILREGVTVNRSTSSGGFTELGASVFLMACSHVGHDCVVEDHVVLANGALLGGYVRVGRHSFLGGMAGVHQFCRIGEGVMVGGHGSISKDVAPFLTVVDRNVVVGINRVGLKRRGFTSDESAKLNGVYRELFFGASRVRERAQELLEGLEEAADNDDLRGGFLRFFLEGKRGFAVPSRKGPPREI